ncbi:unnamed protein product [Clonostachys rosea f. rosea IK726]|uniref:Uncharacterized protein n=1 Tax=Clonostachys rosea f. rosea IK726 TaxID=1349383 RepID=A0ACA9UNQ1_BIOOC|nr:unnamed protein product [Clonostachys rosea f. rosea IK726]
MNFPVAGEDKMAEWLASPHTKYLSNAQRSSLFYIHINSSYGSMGENFMVNVIEVFVKSLDFLGGKEETSGGK